MNKQFKIVFIIYLLSTLSIFAQDSAGLYLKGVVKTTIISKQALLDFKIKGDDTTNQVVSFKLRVNTQPSILIKGNELDGKAKSYITRAPKDSKIILFDIRREKKDSQEVAAIKFTLSEA